MRILLFSNFSAASLNQIWSKHYYLCYHLGVGTKIGGVAGLVGIFLDVFAFEKGFGADLLLGFPSGSGRRRRELMVRLNLFKIMRNFKSWNFHAHFFVSMHFEGA